MNSLAAIQPKKESQKSHKRNDIHRSQHKHYTTSSQKLGFSSTATHMQNTCSHASSQGAD
jgi:hypothetical protein